MLSIKEVSNQTGLPYDFLRRSIKALEEELTPYLQRGENNAILLDESAMGIVEQIKTLKERGFAVSAVSKEIRKHLSSTAKPTPVSGQTVSNQIDSEVYEKLLDAEKAKHTAELEAHHIKLESVQNEFKQFKSTVLLLTDGRGTDLRSITAEKEKEAVIKGKRMSLYEDLQGLKFWQGGRRKNILRRLEKLENEDEKKNKAA